MPCTSNRDDDFMEMLILHTTQERKKGVAARVRSYTCPFITVNQALGKLDQAIKQASRIESRDQEGILAIKTFDRRRRWKYGAHSGDYPLRGDYNPEHDCQTHTYRQWRPVLLSFDQSPKTCIFSRFGMG